ncbi:AbrB/MazE/SpoVT family DNA-binding domain-containing protein [Tractidigestivibacter scatoligenes]|jgi:AbrB family looped-hinge helix DNA binding protein|uniref:AbrB/MazE/SpoVT family DNA-binding domain-containing protein n=1 Tax=Tractidigestivibacter scatoligenes TaxID=1299998 RepID=UPI002F35A124
MSSEVLAVSSKGQVVLPAKLRKRLSIESGDHLAIYTSGDVIMLKKIEMPREEDFRSHLDEAQAWAKSVGYRESDVNDAIAAVRARKRS